MDMVIIAAGLITCSLLFGIVTAVAASNKGRSGFGWFLLGVLLGPFGLILSLVVSKNEAGLIEQETVKKCPYCTETIKAEAIVCRFCGKYLPEPVERSPARGKYEFRETDFGQTEFREIQWGSNISKLANMVLEKGDGNSKHYVRKKDKMKIGDVKIDKIVYIFYKDRFCAVRVHYHGIEKLTGLKRVFIEHYGEGAKAKEFKETYYWRGSIVNIRLDYQERGDEGDLWYYYKPILMEKKADIEQKENKGTENL